MEKTTKPIKKDLNKSFEKETAIKSTKKSMTGKPLDQIIMNPQQKNVNTQSEDAVANLPVLQERKALTLAQRQQRSRTLRRNEPKLERAKEVAKHRLASDDKIKSRAMVAARNIVKKRFAARKGVDYATLSTPEKIQVDRIVDKKIKLVKKIAARLVPTIRKAEATRLQSFMKGTALKSITTPNPDTQGIVPKMSANESFEQVIADFGSHSKSDLIKIIEAMIKEDNTPFTEQLQKMLEAILPKDAISESLQKKAAKSGIEFSTLQEVYARGLKEWKPIGKTTQEQYAFSRVNSYISAGRAYKVDSDLHEVKTLDDAFGAFVSFLDEDKDRLNELSSLSKERLANTIHDLKTKGIPEKALKMIAKKKYMKAAKTEKNESLDESFNIAYAAGIGVTLTSADLGMQMTGAFDLHPSVVEEADIEEEVTTADVKAVKVAGRRKADGTMSPPHWAKIKKGRAIIKSGNLTDGEDDENV